MESSDFVDSRLTQAITQISDKSPASIWRANFDNIEMVGMGHRHDLKRTQRTGKTGSPAQFGEASRITAPSGR